MGGPWKMPSCRQPSPLMDLSVPWKPSNWKEVILTAPHGISNVSWKPKSPNQSTFKLTRRRLLEHPMFNQFIRHIYLAAVNRQDPSKHASRFYRSSDHRS